MSIRRFVISLMIVAYMTMEVIWFGPFTDELRTPVFAWLSLLGLKQNWAMFANLGNGSAHSLVTVTYDDGLVRYCEYPRVEKMNVLSKYHFEKFLVFEEASGSGVFPDLRASEASYFARAFRDQNDPPFMVSLAYKSASFPVHPFILQSELLEHGKTTTYFNFKPERRL